MALQNVVEASPDEPSSQSTHINHFARLFFAQNVHPF